MFRRLQIILCLTDGASHGDVATFVIKFPPEHVDDGDGVDGNTDRILPPYQDEFGPPRMYVTLAPPSSTGAAQDNRTVIAGRNLQLGSCA